MGQYDGWREYVPPVKRGGRKEPLSRMVTTGSASDSRTAPASKVARGPVQAPDYSHFPKVCIAAGLPEPVGEYRFAPPRRWRFDWAWTSSEHQIALEIDGGVWTQGRHTRGKGAIGDMEKLNAAAILGWKVLRVTPDQLLTHGVGLVQQAMHKW
jgi:hypothetical protein